MSGHAKRQYTKYINDFSRRLKKPFQNVARLMISGFSDEEYVNTFKECYPHLWQDICTKHTFYRKEDERLVKRGKKRRYKFPKPYFFILLRAKHILNNTRNKEENTKNALSDVERAELINILRSNSLLLMEKQKQKEDQKQEFIQFVKPSYSGFLLGKYLRHRRTHPEDVDTCYMLLQEASKYKCRETIDLLQKVNASERNYHLRFFAFMTLQRFGFKEIKLRKNPKGKVRPGDKEKPKPMNTPKDLINAIYNSQLEHHKSFDLFLSHSSQDIDELLRIKTMLNACGFNVYIDWVNDKEELRRDLTNEDTARVVIERIRASKVLMYIETYASVNSQWTPWELGYAHALGKKIIILRINEVKEIPAYLGIYDQATIDNDRIIIKHEDKDVDIIDYIKQ